MEHLKLSIHKENFHLHLNNLLVAHILYYKIIFRHKFIFQEWLDLQSYEKPLKTPTQDKKHRYRQGKIVSRYFRYLLTSRHGLIGKIFDFLGIFVYIKQLRKMSLNKSFLSCHMSTANFFPLFRKRSQKWRRRARPPQSHQPPASPPPSPPPPPPSSASSPSLRPQRIYSGDDTDDTTRTAWHLPLRADVPNQTSNGCRSQIHSGLITGRLRTVRS